MLYLPDDFSFTLSGLLQVGAALVPLVQVIGDNFCNQQVLTMLLFLQCSDMSFLPENGILVAVVQSILFVITWHKLNDTLCM